MDKLVTKQSSGTSLYKQIDGVKYDRSALDLADHLHKDGKLDLQDAKKLWVDVEDGSGVTDTEKRTIEYIRDKMTLTDGAKEYFATQLGDDKKEEAENAAKEDGGSPAKKAKTAKAATPVTPSERPTRERKQVTTK